MTGSPQASILGPRFPLVPLHGILRRRYPRRTNAMGDRSALIGRPSPARCPVLSGDRRNSRRAPLHPPSHRACRAGLAVACTDRVPDCGRVASGSDRTRAGRLSDERGPMALGPTAWIKTWIKTSASGTNRRFTRLWRG